MNKSSSQVSATSESIWTKSTSSLFLEPMLPPEQYTNRINPQLSIVICKGNLVQPLFGHARGAAGWQEDGRTGCAV
jgi:hypothetical protein